jgi:hypothetical protein
MDQGLQRQGRVRKPETVTRPCCSFRRRRVGGGSKAIPGVRQGGASPSGLIAAGLGSSPMQAVQARGSNPTRRRGGAGLQIHFEPAPSEDPPCACSCVSFFDKASDFASTDQTIAPSL